MGGFDAEGMGDSFGWNVCLPDSLSCWQTWFLPECSGQGAVGASC